MKIIVDISFKAYEEIKRVKGFKTYPEHVISQGVPLDTLIREIDLQISDENESSYADFENYKETYLGVEADDLPDDFFYFGLSRAKQIFHDCISKIFKGAADGNAE